MTDAVIDRSPLAYASPATPVASALAWPVRLAFLVVGAIATVALAADLAVPVLAGDGDSPWMSSQVLDAGREIGDVWSGRNPNGWRQPFKEQGTLLPLVAGPLLILAAFDLRGVGRVARLLAATLIAAALARDALYGTEWLPASNSCFGPHPPRYDGVGAVAIPLGLRWPLLPVLIAAALPAAWRGRAIDVALAVGLLAFATAALVDPRQTVGWYVDFWQNVSEDRRTIVEPIVEQLMYGPDGESENGDTPLAHGSLRAAGVGAVLCALALFPPRRAWALRWLAAAAILPRLAFDAITTLDVTSYVATAPRGPIAGPVAFLADVSAYALPLAMAVAASVLVAWRVLVPRTR